MAKRLTENTVAEQPGEARRVEGSAKEQRPGHGDQFPRRAAKRTASSAARISARALLQLS
jgi:hypothetical protein